MLGTLNGALEVRGIRLAPQDIDAEAEGVMHLRDRMPMLEEIIVHYRLRVPAAARETVDRALATHDAKCPTARSLEGAIKVTWTAEITETKPTLEETLLADEARADALLPPRREIRQRPTPHPE